MNDPKRLCEVGSELELALLDSARDDVAPKHVRSRVHAVLGLGAVVGAGATTAASAGAATKGASALVSLGVVKWVGIAVLGGVVAAGATEYVARSRPEAARQHEAPDVARDRPPPSKVSSAVVPPPPRASEVEAPVVADVPHPPAPTVATTGDVLATSPAPQPPKGLLDELTPIDDARTALDLGDTGLALRQLDRHDLDYPHGQLAPEALALRIEAYAQRRDGTRALELADAFLARYPEHPQARHVLSIANGIRSPKNP